MRPLLRTGLATGLLAATLLTAPGAHAVAETCQGGAATVVGMPEQYGLTGTEGDDVIVTNGADGVPALGGNDLVCVTGGSSPLEDVSVDAGAGDDVVDASAAASGVSVELGAGSDTYTGAAQDETVHGGTDGYDGGPRVDTDRDVITTRSGGSDRVVSGSDPVVPNRDVVVLGPYDGTGFGNEVSWRGPMAADARLDGGGAAGLAFGVGAGTVVVSAVEGTLTEDGQVTLRWTGFDDYRTGSTTSPAPELFRFVGSDRDENLNVEFADAHEGRQLVDLGGGRDTLSLGDGNVGGPRSAYSGGAGRDDVALWAGGTLDLDLASGRMKTRAGGREMRSRLRSFSSQLVGARELVLEGTRKADELRFYACQATVRGRGGADDIRQSRGDDYFEAGLRCNPRRFRLLGGGGNDTMQGSTDGDVLVGGPGRDTINGNGGRDRCSGERLHSCEVRLR